jgi:hypothetical protein
MNESKEKRKTSKEERKKCALEAGGKLVEKRLRMEETNAQGTRDVVFEIMNGHGKRDHDD